MFQSKRDLLSLLCAIPLALGLVAMGCDNAYRIHQCEAIGRTPAECRLVVLGR